MNLSSWLSQVVSVGDIKLVERNGAIIHYSVTKCHPPSPSRDEFYRVSEAADKLDFYTCFFKRINSNTVELRIRSNAGVCRIPGLYSPSAQPHLSI